MTDQLREIFETKFAENLTIPSEKLEIYKENAELWEKIEPLIGRETARTLQNQIWDLSHQTSYEWFREGFRLGAALVQEMR